MEIFVVVLVVVCYDVDYFGFINVFLVVVSDFILFRYNDKVVLESYYVVIVFFMMWVIIFSFEVFVILE